MRQAVLLACTIAVTGAKWLYSDSPGTSCPVTHTHTHTYAPVRQDGVCPVPGHLPTHCPGSSEVGKQLCVPVPVMASLWVALVTMQPAPMGTVRGTSLQGGKA